VNNCRVDIVRNSTPVFHSKTQKRTRKMSAMSALWRRALFLAQKRRGRTQRKIRTYVRQVCGTLQSGIACGSFLEKEVIAGK